MSMILLESEIYINPDKVVAIKGGDLYMEGLDKPIKVTYMDVLHITDAFIKKEKCLNSIAGLFKGNDW